MAPQIEATILQGWRLTSPQIIGVKTSGQLGGREELLDAYNLFLEIVVKPVQEEVLKALEKVIFLKTGKTVNLGVEQNQLLPTLEQTVVGDVKGI